MAIKTNGKLTTVLIESIGIKKMCGKKFSR